jgi:hypothetical protein
MFRVLEKSANHFPRLGKRRSIIFVLWDFDWTCDYGEEDGGGEEEREVL